MNTRSTRLGKRTRVSDEVEQGGSVKRRPLLEEKRGLEEDPILIDDESSDDVQIVSLQSAKPKSSLEKTDIFALKAQLTRNRKSADVDGKAGSSKEGSLPWLADVDSEGYDDEPFSRGLFSATQHKVLNFSTALTLKPDHASRPLWITPNRKIYLEAFSPVYRQAYDFLVAVAEPRARPSLIHEYELTPYSLFAAVSIGLKTEDIIQVLRRLSKVSIDSAVEDYIRLSTASYGRCKLVLQNNKFFVESAHSEVIEKLLADPELVAACIGEVDQDGKRKVVPQVRHERITGGQFAGSTKEPALQDSVADTLALLDEDDDFAMAQEDRVYSFEVVSDKVEVVKKRGEVLKYPLMEEYDFRNDSINLNLPIDLKTTTSIRNYQEKSLSKMFGNGRGRSGIIVLPCGAGKTLVGITSVCTVKKNTLVLCTSSVSAEQWRNQFRMWSTIDQKNIARFTSQQKENFGDPAVVITTYTMIAYNGSRSAEAERIMGKIRSREWGLLVFDEVHVVPANVFRTVIGIAKAHCKLGLTATLVREDDLTDDLYFLIGPKLYEANWLDLQNVGHLARVSCAEVWCPMTEEFMREYINDRASRKALLHIMNPNKFNACQFLINYHESLGDKTLVFSDNIFALEEYAKKMGRYFIYGPTSQEDRIQILSRFQNDPRVNTIFISKVGDTSIDLPEANVIIQISSHFGSRRQEAQRLGRILRPKGKSRSDEFNAFFYTLISTDTDEMFYSRKRQQFLVDQGYSFKVIANLVDLSTSEYHYGTKERQLELLSRVLSVDSSLANIEEDIPDEDRDQLLNANTAKKNTAPKAVRKTANLSALTGADDNVYTEVPTSTRKVTSGSSRAEKGSANKILKKMQTKQSDP